MSREKRDANRKNRDKSIKEKIDALIGLHFGVMNRQKISLDNFDQCLTAFENDLSNINLCVTELRQAMVGLEKFLSAKNHENDWDFPLPRVPMRLRRGPQTRTEKWNQRSREAGEIARFLEGYFASHDINELDANELIQLLILSIVFHSSVWRSEAVIRLLNSLGGSCKLEPSVVNGSAIICRDVKVKAKNVFTVEDENNKYIIQRCFFDAYTINIFSAICKSSYKESILSIIEDIDERAVFSGIGAFLKRNGLRRLEKINSLRNLCDVASVYAEKYCNVSFATLQAAVEKVVTVDLPSGYWLEMLGGGSEIKIELIKKTNIPFKSEVFADKFLAKDKVVFGKSNLQCLKALRKVYSVRVNSAKLTKAEAESRLSDINFDDWPDEMLPLLGWIQSLHSSDRRLKISSIRRYLSEIANDWVIQIDGLKISDLTDEDFSALYRSLLDAIPDVQRRCYKSRCLEEFHNYCVKHHGFPPILDDTFIFGGNMQCVNAGYISNSCYKNILNAIQGSCELTATEIIALQVIVILAYRTGLRIGEILKIRRGDIELSVDRNLFVVNNAYGDNKTSSARRKILLKSLLSDEEYIVFNSLVSSRERENSLMDAALFSSGADNKTRLDARKISVYINSIMRSLYPSLELTFHHFRHTCLSNFQWLIECEYEFLSKLVDLSVDQLITISEEIIGNDCNKIDRYTSLASFAGHSSPETTFKSYLHFNSFILHKKILDQKTFIPTDICKARLGFSTKKFNVVFKQRINFDGLTYQEFYDYIILQFPAVIKTNVEKRVIDVKYGELPVSHTTLFHTYKVLSDCQNGASLEMLELRYGIPIKKIVSWVETARSISRIDTRDGGSRMISSTIATLIGEKLLPPLVVEYAEVKFLNSLVENLRKKLGVKLGVTRKISQEKVDQLKIALCYYLTHSLIANSGVPFKNTKELIQFVESFNPAIGITQWRLAIGNGDSFILSAAYMDKCIGRLTSEKLTLYLRHPNESKIIADNSQFKKYSSQVLRFFLHMTAIRVLTPLDVMGLL